MSTSPLTTRSLANQEEYAAYFWMATRAFSRSPDPSKEEAERRIYSLKNSPNFRVEQVRGVFRDGQTVGGCIVHERLLRMGATRISTGCIGTVVTSSEYRNQGIASTLMQDAIDFARKNNHPLLLLDGIPKFYYRYGYTDMFDVTSIEVDRAAILAQKPTGYQIRPVAIDDAADLLDLYKRHYQGFTGSFERSLEFQTYRLRQAQMMPVVALSPQGRIEGYLYQGQGDELSMGKEIAANNWNALLALLHYHASSFEADQAPVNLAYLLPSDSPMTQWMIDTLEVPDTSHWQPSPAHQWGVRSIAYHHRFTGWMARLVNFPLLMRSILPELQARWQRGLAQWSGSIALTIDGETCTLRITGTELQLVDSPDEATSRLELTPQALVQLIFGYRTASRLTDLSHLSDDASNVLSILFPQGHTWIPGTDWF